MKIIVIYLNLGTYSTQIEQVQFLYNEHYLILKMVCLVMLFFIFAWIWLRLTLYFSRLPLVLSRIVSTSFALKLIEAVVIFETFNASFVINKIIFKNIFCQKKIPSEIGTTRQLYNFNLNQQNFDKEKLSRSDLLIKLRNDLKPPETT